MEKEKLESLIIDYIDGRLSSDDRAMVDRELAENADARRLYDELREVIGVIESSSGMYPSPALKTRFEKALQNEISVSPRGRTLFFQPAFYKVAAAVALMLLSGAAGFWISRMNSQNARLAEVEREMELTRKQLAETKLAMMNMLENEQSPSQRIRGVNVAMDLSQTDDEIMDALFNTMNNDPNTNVRLAALGALAKFQRDPLVRKKLIAALPAQRDAMVQIALIRLLVQMRDKQVVDDLRRIVNDSGAMKAVKDEAYSGILKLS